MSWWASVALAVLLFAVPLRYKLTGILGALGSGGILGKWVHVTWILGSAVAKPTPSRFVLLLIAWLVMGAVQAIVYRYSSLINVVRFVRRYFSHKCRGLIQEIDIQNPSSQFGYISANICNQVVDAADLLGPRIRKFVTSPRMLLPAALSCMNYQGTSIVLIRGNPEESDAHRWQIAHEVGHLSGWQWNRRHDRAYTIMLVVVALVTVMPFLTSTQAFASFAGVLVCMSASAMLSLLLRESGADYYASRYATISDESAIAQLEARLRTSEVRSVIDWLRNRHRRHLVRKIRSGRRASIEYEDNLVRGFLALSIAIVSGTCGYVYGVQSGRIQLAVTGATAVALLFVSYPATHLGIRLEGFIERRISVVTQRKSASGHITRSRKPILDVWCYKLFAFLMLTTRG